MQKICSSNSSVVAVIYDPNKSRAFIRLDLLEIWKGGCQIASPKEKTTPKKPSLIRVKLWNISHHLFKSLKLKLIYSSPPPLQRKSYPQKAQPHLRVRLWNIFHHLFKSLKLKLIYSQIQNNLSRMFIYEKENNLI